MHSREILSLNQSNIFRVRKFNNNKYNVTSDGLVKLSPILWLFLTKYCSVPSQKNISFRLIKGFYSKWFSISMARNNLRFKRNTRML